MKVTVFCKAFLSFSKDINIAIDFLKNNSIKQGYCYVFYEINPIDKNEIQNYNISNINLKDSSYDYEKETLFLPGSSF